MSKRATILFTAALVLAGFGPAWAETTDPLALYEQMHTAMAADSADGVAAAATELARQVKDSAGTAQAPEAYRALAVAAEKMTGGDLALLREQFKDLSKAFAGFVNAGGASGAQLYYCPMADGYWLQKQGDHALRNPYYGKSMLRCGEKVDKVGS